MMPEEQHWTTCAALPLAIYREVVAHLRQVPGVDAELVPQRSQVFDYNQSQVGGLCYSFATSTDEAARQRVAQILQYYGDRFGPWQPLAPIS